MEIREACEGELIVIARHFYQLWLDNNIAVADIETNWENIVLEFIESARENLAYRAFVANIENKVIASVGCQLFSGLYPHVLSSSVRKYGYIWGVYVEKAYRHQGIAKQLTLKAIEYLKYLGCTKAILHASPSGIPVYKSLGFIASNEMSLDLL